MMQADPSSQGNTSTKTKRQRFFLNLNAPKRHMLPITQEKLVRFLINSQGISAQTGSTVDKFQRFQKSTPEHQYSKSPSPNNKQEPHQLYAVQEHVLLAASSKFVIMTHVQFRQNMYSSDARTEVQSQQPTLSTHRSTKNGQPVTVVTSMNQAPMTSSRKKPNLGYRRVVDITDDGSSHQNSSNKLITTVGEEQKTDRDIQQTQDSQYSLFYHSQQRQPVDSARGSKKSLKQFLPKSDAPKPIQPFQLTQKPTLIHDNSQSTSRERERPNGYFQIKKGSFQQTQVTAGISQVPHIGKKQPIVLRKNNFLAKKFTDQSPNSTTGYVSILNSTERNLNNTNNLIHTQNQSSILKSSFNSSGGYQSSGVYRVNKKEVIKPMLIKLNKSKKRLDTARRSRIQELQSNSNTGTVQEQQEPLGAPRGQSLQGKKKSFIVPKIPLMDGSAMNSFRPTEKKSARTTTNNQPDFSHRAVQEAAQSLDRASLGQSQTTDQRNTSMKRGQIFRRQMGKAQQNTQNISPARANHPESARTGGAVGSNGRAGGLSSRTNNSNLRNQENELKLETIGTTEDMGTIETDRNKLELTQVLHRDQAKDTLEPVEIKEEETKVDSLSSEQKILNMIKKPDLQIQIETFQTVEEQEIEKIETEPEIFAISEAVPQDEESKIIEKLTPEIDNQMTPQTEHRSFEAQALRSSTAQKAKDTACSFKSYNSQHGGVDPDSIIKFPMTPGRALKNYLNQISDYEKGEILEYNEVYFLGLEAQKIKGSPSNEHNFGYDDDKGDYKVVLKDQVAYRYEIIDFLGKGSFGQALKAKDHKTGEIVAIKVVKNKKKYAYQAGIELKILNFLKENDPDDIMNVIHMKDYVIFRKHLCITFEIMSMNLFEFLKANDFCGFDHNLIRRFAIQLLYALKYLKEFEIIHCDLKPENILLKEPNKSGIKIIDFGSSTFYDERVYTYIQSRFYRAPEIMLGIPYTSSIDMWSFGCIMAELYIGYPIFPGDSENDQMSRIFEMLGVPDPDVYAVSQRKQKFFKEHSTTQYDPVMLKNSRGKLRKSGGKPLKMVIGNEDPEFTDFISKCLCWNPETRMSPDDALRHVWILKGLPPQVLIHHQKMHNIDTPDLPHKVQEIRTKFLAENKGFNEDTKKRNNHHIQDSQRTNERAKASLNKLTPRSNQPVSARRAESGKKEKSKNYVLAEAAAKMGVVTSRKAPKTSARGQFKFI